MVYFYLDKLRPNREQQGERRPDPSVGPPEWRHDAPEAEVLRLDGADGACWLYRQTELPSSRRADFAAV